mgnify:CR=1 FL=1
MEDLSKALEGQVEWARSFVFNNVGKVLARSKCNPTDSEVQELLKAYNDRDTCITNGLTVEGVDFEVHRFHPPLIYGRKADNDKTEGICLARGKNSSGDIMYLLVIYGMPYVSARIIPQQIEFFNANIGVLDKLYES